MIPALLAQNHELKPDQIIGFLVGAAIVGTCLGLFLGGIALYIRRRLPPAPPESNESPPSPEKPS